MYLAGPIAAWCLELLCIKLDHRAGDGRALHEYAYLLAHIYNRLGDNPSYVPVPNVNGSRSMMQVGDQFDLPEKWRIFRHILKLYKDMGRLGTMALSYAAGQTIGIRLRGVATGCRPRKRHFQVWPAAPGHGQSGALGGVLSGRLRSIAPLYGSSSPAKHRH